MEKLPAHVRQNKNKEGKVWGGNILIDEMKLFERRLGKIPTPYLSILNKFAESTSDIDSQDSFLLYIRSL